MRGLKQCLEALNLRITLLTNRINRLSTPPEIRKFYIKERKAIVRAVGGIDHYIARPRARCMAQDRTINYSVIYSEKDHSYLAKADKHPDLVGFGYSPVEALAELVLRIPLDQKEKDRDMTFGKSELVTKLPL